MRTIHRYEMPITDFLGVLPDSHPADVADLTAVLLAWRREVHTDSDRELLDVDTALAAIQAGHRRSWKRNRA